ncbi:MAG TPA: WD40 repeat domain-containing protein [Ktedonobacteraceae bacterium]
MPQKEKRFTAGRIDEQFEQLAQAALSPSDTPNHHVVESLQTIYSKQIHQEQQSIERMRQRLSLSVTARQQEKQGVTDESMPPVSEVAKVPQKRVPVSLASPGRPWVRVFEQAVAVLLVLAIAASWFAISHLPRSSSGSAAVFSDASAQPFGAPIATIQGNFTYEEGWSLDSRTYDSLQVDTQKHQLEVQILDVATRHSTIYPVLDSSWISALSLYDPFQILMGRYLLAEHAQGKNQATVVIWDITGQRAIMTQTVPAQTAQNGQVVSPLILSSKNEQKLAVFSPDGAVTIWDVASGQKLLTCEGKVSYNIRSTIPNIKWYNHDQSLLYLDTESSHLEVWSTTTGKRLFGLNYGSKTYIVPLVSPNNKYLALSLGHQQTGAASTSYHTDTLEILDAISGQVLHSYHLTDPNGTGESYSWLSDSQSLLVQYFHDGNPPERVSTWNVFTNKKTSITTILSQIEFFSPTPDRQYLILGGPNGRSMEIWQTSSSHKVATVATPGTYARSDSFFYNNNQYMIIGQRGNFDIWDIATGKLLYKYHGSTPFSINGVDGSNVLWSPDGKYLTMIAGKAPSIGDGAVSIWRMP